MSTETVTEIQTIWKGKRETGITNLPDLQEESISWTWFTKVLCYQHVRMSLDGFIKSCCLHPISSQREGIFAEGKSACSLFVADFLCRFVCSCFPSQDRRLQIAISQPVPIFVGCLLRHRALLRILIRNQESRFFSIRYMEVTRNVLYPHVSSISFQEWRWTYTYRVSPDLLQLEFMVQWWPVLNGEFNLTVCEVILRPQPTWYTMYTIWISQMQRLFGCLHCCGTTNCGITGMSDCEMTTCECEWWWVFSPNGT